MASFEDREAGFRYGVVFLLTLTLLVFVIVAPAADWAQAIACALQWLALLTVVATSRASSSVRRPVAIVLLGTASFTVLRLSGPARLAPPSTPGVEATARGRSPLSSRGRSRCCRSCRWRGP